MGDSNPILVMGSLEAKHDEADARLILHCLKAIRASHFVVSLYDTGLLFPVIACFYLMPCQSIWVMAGTAKSQKYIHA